MQPAAAAPAQRTDNLALLYQSVFTGIVRIQSGRQPLVDIELFRRRMKAALQEIEREAAAAGYGNPEIKDAEFAVVAFLDETILSSKDPKAEEWRKRPLNTELFGQAIAGDVFFDRLTEIERRRDSQRGADLLEVYLLCLLLGFKGRFGPPLRDEAYRIMERVRIRVEAARGLDYRLAGPLELRGETAAPPPPVRFAWRWWALGAAVILVLFLVYHLNLLFQVERLNSALFDLK